MVLETGMHISDFKDTFIYRGGKSAFDMIRRDRALMFYLGIILVILFLGVVGPYIAPYQYDESLRGDDGQLLRAEAPSLDHPLGTTSRGYDVFSRLLYGAQPTAITGLLGGSMIITIGATIGIAAGYIGGRVDSVLMRLTDFVYGVPLIPFAIVLVAIFGAGFFQSIIVIGLVLWRGSARVLRSQVLQIKERPFIQAAKAMGASTPHIMVKHMFPNLIPMTAFFFAVGIGNTILIQAGLAFLGVSSPFIPSWGVMLRNAYASGYLAEAWWWSIPPGIMISLVVLSTIMIGRSIETIGEQEEIDEALAQAG